MAFHVGMAQAAPDDFTALSLEELGAIKVPTVFGASKHEQQISEAPSVVSIVTKQEIKENGYRTLADILREVRGFYVSYDRGYSSIGVRGFNRPGDFGGRTLLMVDGHRMNDGIFDSAASGSDFILDADLIDHVEIIRGPGSSLYGNNAFFGVINVVTRRGGDIGGAYGAELSASAGSYDTYAGRISYGARMHDDLEFMVSASGLESAGEERLRYPEFVAKGLDGGKSPSAYASIRYHDFTLTAGYVDREKDWPTAAYGTGPNSRDPNLYTVDERSFADLKYQRTLDGEWQVTARTYFDRYRYDADYPYSGSSMATVINRDYALAHTVGAELTASKTWLEKHRVTTGADWREDLELTQENRDLAPRAVYMKSHDDAATVGVFAQDEYNIRTNLILNAGIRYDNVSSFGDTANPRAALIYVPWKGSAFKALYGQAFRAPNAYERDYQSSQNIPNSHLEAERISSYELAYEQTMGPRWRGTVSLFWNDIRDLIDLRTFPGSDPSSPDDDRFRFENIGSVRSRGVEFEVSGKWPCGLRTMANYTYAEVEDTDTGKTLSNSPEHMGKVQLNVPLWRERIFGGLELQTMSSRRTVGRGEVDPFWVANFTLFSHELIKGVELSASIYNLFDERFRDPVSDDFFFTGPRSGRMIDLESVQQSGRTFRVKVTWRF